MDTINACYELLEKHNFFVGSSSGSLFGAVKKYFIDRKVREPVNVITVFEDRGQCYFDTIYNKA